MRLILQALSVVKKAIDFHVLILYSASLLNSLRSSYTVLVGCFGSPLCRIISSANSDHVASFRLVSPFLSFSYLITLPELEMYSSSSGIGVIGSRSLKICPQHSHSVLCSVLRQTASVLYLLFIKTLHFI